MSSVKGTVSNTYEKEWAGQDGPVILHSFQLQGDKRYFRTGTSKVVSRGEAVAFDVEGNNNLREGSLTKMENSTQAAPAPRAAWNGGGKPKATENFEARQQYWTNKEARDIEVVEPRITWSSARTAAIEVIGLALQHDALAFGNASKGAKLGMILDFVDEVAARFYHQSMSAADTAAEVLSSTPKVAKVTKAAARDTDGE